MRTLIVLNSDTEALVRQAMAERAMTFDQVIDDAVQQALGPRPGLTPPVFVQQTFDCGPCLLGDVNFNHLAAELEDEELVAKFRRTSAQDGASIG
jgi:hypothetical protein